MDDSPRSVAVDSPLGLEAVDYVDGLLVGAGLEVAEADVDQHVFALIVLADVLSERHGAAVHARRCGRSSEGAGEAREGQKADEQQGEASAHGPTLAGAVARYKGTNG